MRIETLIASLLMWIGIFWAATALTGCSTAALLGEEGYEYSFRFAPITKTDATYSYDTKTIRFGKSRAQYNREEAGS